MSNATFCPFSQNNICMKSKCGVYSLAEDECSLCSLPSIEANLYDLMHTIPQQRVPKESEN